jgi:hypothetical protein
MRRREFISLLGGAATAWPLAARAQQGLRRIGVLMGFPESDSEAQANIAGFREGLQKLGWRGRNIRIDTRWVTPADADSMQRFAKELVALQPDLILSNTTPTTAAPATNTHHPHRLRDGCRSGRQRLRRELSAAGRKRHRFRRNRGLARGQVGRSCLRRLRHVLPGSRCCSTRQRRPMPRFT